MSEINRAVKTAKIDSYNLRLGLRLASVQGTMPKMNKVVMEEKNRIKMRDMLSKHRSLPKKKHAEPKIPNTTIENLYAAVELKVNSIENYHDLQEREIIKM